MREHKLNISIGIEKSEVLHFTQEGGFVYKCPFCGEILEFDIRGLGDTTTPTVSIVATEYYREDK